LRRIIFIFDRLTAKYRDNIELWKEYCLFCYKIKSNKMFYKAVSNAMSMNWHSLDIWLLAVYYQVEMNNNPFRARKIFLKAIKMNPERRV
jgi:U3 small nucleolar RNA-associated protein 6